MLTSRTDLQDGGQALIAPSPILLLWSPPTREEQALIVDEDWRAGRHPVITKAPSEPWNRAVTGRALPDAVPDRAATTRDGMARARDVAGALALLVICLPLLVLLALIIWLTDRGPPIFAHNRIGQDGKAFKCYKLRSMHRNAESRLEQLLRDNPEMRSEWAHNRKLSRDPRITWFGGFLRSSSLDELPQLFNVINGTMALVGPRPIVLDELQCYGRHAACYLQCKPGLTGVWQVSGRSDTSYRRRVAADRLYLRRRSFVFDGKLLISTLPAVLTRKGAC
jgi:lipopolysaccharide/colanic/teichoic acid biosynthesis glycosyltransferase